MPEKLAQGPRIGHDLSKVSAGLSRGPNLQRKLTAAPWSGTWPAPGSTLDLDFANNRGWVRGVGQGGVMDAITFTRASNGTYVGADGLLKSYSNQGALGKNLLKSPQDFDSSDWTKTRSSILPNVTVAPDGTLTADKLIEDSSASTTHLAQQTSSLGSGVQATFSIYCKSAERNWCRVSLNANTGADASVYVNLDTGAHGASAGGTYSIENAGSGWWKISVTGTTSTTNAIPIVLIANGDSGQSYSGNGTSGIYIWGAQLELGSTATTYYPTNIGLPRLDWASTDRTGSGTQASPYVIPLAAASTCNGILIEESRANRLLWCRDATQPNWVCTNVTPLKDQVGIDGVANAASSLTASADNGTCIQTITLASGSRTGSVYLKRLTGTGNVQVSLDGSTWSTVDLSSTEWRRIVLSGTVTNPVVGIKLATNGDAVAMDYGQVEDNSSTYTGATTPILTTAASATRSAEVKTMPMRMAWYNPHEGSMVFVGNCIANGSSAKYIMNFSGGTGMLLYFGGASPSITLALSDDGGNAVPRSTATLQNIPNNKGAVSYSKKFCAAVLNGILNTSGQIVTTWGTAPLREGTMEIGGAGGSNTMTINRLIYFPKALSPSAIREMTV